MQQIIRIGKHVRHGFNNQRLVEKVNNLINRLVTI